MKTMCCTAAFKLCSYNILENCNFTNAITYILFTGDYYQVVRNYDCLLGMNLSALSPNLSFEECKVWCNNNRTCGGFIATDGMCYFKSQECKDNMQSVLDTTLYIKEGSLIISSVFFSKKILCITW